MINKEYDFSKFKDEDYVEFYTVTDVYQTSEIKDTKTNEIVEEYNLVKRDVKCKRKVYKYDISYIKEVFNNKGNIRRQRVEVGIRNYDPILVLGRYRDLNNCLFESKTTPNNVGFKFY